MASVAAPWPRKPCPAGCMPTIRIRVGSLVDRPARAVVLSIACDNTGRNAMASYRRIEVKPLAGALGAEIGGVDLKHVDGKTFSEIQAAWLEHLVVFFRNQKITPQEQIAFAKRFGEIHYHPFMKGWRSIPRSWRSSR